MAFRNKKSPVRFLFLLIVIISLAGFLFVQYKKKAFLKDLTYLQLPQLTLSSSAPQLSILKRSLTLHDLIVKTRTDSDSIHLYIPSLKIKDIGYMDLLFSNTLSATTLTLDQPHVLTTGNDTLPPLQQNTQNTKSPLVKIEKVELAGATFTRRNTSLDTLTYIGEISADITSLQSSPSDPSLTKIGDYAVTLKHIINRIDKHKLLNIESATLNNQQWNIKNVFLTPEQDKEHYQNFLTYQDDWIAAQLEELTIHEPVIDHLQDSLFHARWIDVSGLNLEIYRDKTLPRKNIYIPVLTEQLNDLPLGINIDSILVQDAKLTYGERLPEKATYGSITLHDINTSIYRLNTIEKDTMHILFNGRPDIQGQIKGSLLLPLSSENAHFELHSYMHNIDFASMNSFTGTNMNITNEGTINHAYFTVTGNMHTATGRAFVDYEDLQVSLLNKKSGRVKKFMSSVANLIVPRDHKKETDQTFTVTRKTDRSFYNYLWLCMQKGMMVNML